MLSVLVGSETDDGTAESFSRLQLEAYLSSIVCFEISAGDCCGQTVKVTTGLIRCLYRVQNRLNKHKTACSSTSVYEVFFRSIYRKQQHRRLHGVLVLRGLHQRRALTASVFPIINQSAARKCNQGPIRQIFTTNPDGF